MSAFIIHGDHTATEGPGYLLETGDPFGSVHSINVMIQNNGLLGGTSFDYHQDGAAALHLIFLIHATRFFLSRRCTHHQFKPRVSKGYIREGLGRFLGWSLLRETAIALGSGKSKTPNLKEISVASDILFEGPTT